MKSVHCNKWDHEAGRHEAETIAIEAKAEAEASFLGLEAEDLTSCVKVTFMHPCGPAPTFSWPRREDSWITRENVMAAIDICTITDRKYTISDTAAVITKKT